MSLLQVLFLRPLQTSDVTTAYDVSQLGANGYLKVNNYLNPRTMQKQEIEFFDF